MQTKAPALAEARPRAGHLVVPVRSAGLVLLVQRSQQVQPGRLTRRLVIGLVEVLIRCRFRPDPGDGARCRIRRRERAGHVLVDRYRDQRWLALYPERRVVVRRCRDRVVLVPDRVVLVRPGLIVYPDAADGIRRARCTDPAVTSVGQVMPTGWMGDDRVTRASPPVRCPALDRGDRLDRFIRYGRPSQTAHRAGRGPAQRWECPHRRVRRRKSRHRRLKADRRRQGTGGRN
ncbi:hypothetical protein GCM10009635_09440 [Actinocatenispora thailandica]